jgi:cytoskeletal protein CcmA (bactofilin family)
MELEKSEPGVGWERDNCDSQPAQSLQTVESATAEARNGAKIAPIEPETVSISSDGNCCVLKNSNFSGKLRFEGAARIECQVGGGEIHGTDVITIAEGALVTAPIRAAFVLIAGRVNADIVASKRIEIRPSGTVFCNLTAPAMIVHESARIEGNFIMNGRQGSRS